MFPAHLLKEWEKSDGIDFSIALARVTGWLLHVDWWGLSRNAAEDEMKALRVYIGTDANIIYDLSGEKSLQDFIQNVVSPIALRRATSPKGFIISRYYSEEKLYTLPVRIKPSLLKIEKAEKSIYNNSSYLNLIPCRKNPKIPAHLAAQFTFGWCLIFSEANYKILKLPIAAIFVTKYVPQFALSSLGFCHSVNIHPDGQVEDAWGKQPLDRILERFGISEYILMYDIHNKMIEKLKANSPEKYTQIFDLAVSIIHLSRY